MIINASNMVSDAKGRGYGRFVHSIAVVLRRSNPKRSVKTIGVPYRNGFRKLLSYVFVWIKQFTFIKTPIEAIILHNPIYCLPIFVPVILMKRPKVYLHFHGLELRNSGFLYLVFTACIKLLGVCKINLQVLFPSPYFAIQYQRWTVGKIIVFPDQKFVTYSGGVRGKWRILRNVYRSKFLVNRGFGKDLVFVFRSRLIAEKGILDFLALSEEFPDNRFIIVDSFQNDVALPKGTRCSLVSEREMFRLDAPCCLLYLTKFDESLGLVPLEHLCCGDQVISTGTGGFRPLVRGDDAMHIAKSLDDVKSKMAQLIEDKITCSNRRSVYLRLCELYDWV